MTNASNDVHLSAGDARLTLTADGALTYVRGGIRWEGIGPLCVLHYYDRQHPREQTVPVPWSASHSLGTLGTLSLSPTSACELVAIDQRTALARVRLPGNGIAFDLRILLGEEGFSVAIDEAVEESHRLYRILSIEILPGFGAARTGEEGYLTLPNWSGCQTFFDKSYPREVRQSVYSTNDEWEHVCNLPVYGITRAHGTLCGLIAQGDYDAKLVCRVHWERNQANSIHPQFIFRWQQQDERIGGVREIRYAFAAPGSPAGEGYAFCGERYRAFLRNERGLRSWAEKEAERPEAGDFQGRFFLKIFMAYKDPHPEGKGQYHSTCTIAEAQTIIARCLEHGMTKLAVTLVGWGQDGHDGKCPTYLPVDERVGGDAAMRALIAWCQTNDVMLGVHTSHNASYPCSDEFALDEMIQHRTGERWESVVWSGGQAQCLCPAVFVEKYSRRELLGLAELGFHGHHHFDAVGSFMTCHDPRHPVAERRRFIELIRAQFLHAQRIMGGVSTEMPFGPYFDLVDGFFHSYVDPYPWHLASPIGRFFYDRSVPLLGIALHGSVNCCQPLGDDRRSLVKALAFGIVPQAEVCMRPSPAFGIQAYDGSADALARVYRFFYGDGGVAARFGRLSITACTELANGISERSYADGTRLRINLSTEPYRGLAPHSAALVAADGSLAPLALPESPAAAGIA